MFRGVDEGHLVRSLGHVFHYCGGVFDGVVDGRAEESRGSSDDVDDVRGARRGHEVVYRVMSLRSFTVRW